MPNDFCNACGSDTYICQKCGRVHCSNDAPSTWRVDITGNESAGNVCPKCLAAAELDGGSTIAKWKPVKRNGRMLRLDTTR